MKKKIIIASAAMFFALATMFNINALQSNTAGDISLDNIAIMAQAADERGDKGCRFNDMMRICEGRGRGYCRHNNTICF